MSNLLALSVPNIAVYIVGQMYLIVHAQKCHLFVISHYAIELKWQIQQSRPEIWAGPGWTGTARAHRALGLKSSGRHDP